MNQRILEQPNKSRNLIEISSRSVASYSIVVYLLVYLVLEHNLLNCETQNHQGPSAIQFKDNYRHHTTLYENITISNRPLDRPNLPSVNESHSLAKPSGSPSDWLTWGAGDLESSESRATTSHIEAKSGVLKKGEKRIKSNKNSTKPLFDDEQSEASDSNEIFDDVEDGGMLAGTQKEPDCASQGRYYCTYKEEYPTKLVTEVTKYYKWPLEKLFRDLHAQIMPKLAQDATGNLVCDSITRVVRPGWARNTNDRWLVVINTDNYHQYVTEVVCQYGTNSRCNFIPPCYYSSCQQRYNTQKLLVIDPTNPYRGPFLSEFLFPSCCVCYVPTASDTFQDKYRSSPATIYQRTMQQESSNNLYPPQFRPTGLMEEMPGSIADQSTARATVTQGQTIKPGVSSNQAPNPGEIRRAGDQYKRQSSSGSSNSQKSTTNSLSDFPRLGLSDSLIGTELGGANPTTNVRQ